MTTGRSSNLPNLRDLTATMGPDGAQMALVELLSQNNELFNRLTWKKSNGPFHHTVAARTALPSVYVRKFNAGVPRSKGRTDKISEGMAMFAGLSKVDPSLAEASGNAMEFRATEDDGFTQSINNRVERGLFYDSSKTDPENMMGLTARLDTLSGKYASQVVSSSIAHSGSDQTSIWAVVSGPDTVYGIVPPNLPGGIRYKDHGEQLSTDEDGNEWPFLTTKFEINAGLCVADYRYIARLCNIDMSAISKTGTALIDDLTELVYRLEDTKKGEAMLFCNRDMEKYLMYQARSSVGSSTLSIDVDLETRRRLVSFSGIPIYRCDSILKAEDVVA